MKVLNSYKGNALEEGKDLIVWEGKAQREVLDEVLAVLEPRLEEFGFGMAQIMQFSVAIEEIFVNIATYAYDKLPDGDRSEEQKQKRQLPFLSRTGAFHIIH